MRVIPEDSTELRTHLSTRTAFHLIGKQQRVLQTQDTFALFNSLQFILNFEYTCQFLMRDHCSPFDMLNVLLLEKQKVEVFCLQKIDALVAEHPVGQSPFVVVIIDEKNTFPEKSANLLHLLLAVILHLPALTLSDPVHEVNQRLDQSFHLLSSYHPFQPTLKSNALLHVVEQPDHVELRCHRRQFLQFWLTTIEKFQCSVILVPQFVIFHEENGSKQSQGQSLFLRYLCSEVDPGDLLEIAVDELAELLELVAV